MKSDVRGHDTVWLVFRRESPHAYHFQGVAVETEACSAEEIAVSLCRDETYFIFPTPTNVALPERPVEAKGCYWPLAGKKHKKGEAPSIEAAHAVDAICARHRRPATKKLAVRLGGAAGKRAAPKRKVASKK